MCIYIYIHTHLHTVRVYQQSHLISPATAAAAVSLHLEIGKDPTDSAPGCATWFQRYTTQNVALPLMPVSNNN